MTIYSKFLAKLKEIVPNKLVYSGYQNKEKIPYINLMHQGTYLELYSTCFTIEERTLFEIVYYEFQFKTVRNQAGLVEQDLRRYTFNGLQNLDLVSETTNEPYSGIFEVSQTYELMTQRNFSFVKKSYDLKPDLFTSLFSIYESSSFVNDINGFVTTNLVNEKWKKPFIYIDNVSRTVEQGTTCNREYRTEFDIVIQGYSPEALEQIEAKVEDTYNYQNLNLYDQINLLNKESNIISEIYPNLWENRITYVLMKQEAL